MIEKFDKQLNRPNSLDNSIITMANTLARKQTKWSVNETKLFLTAISQINSRDDHNWITLKKSDVIAKLQIDPRHTNTLRDLFKQVALKSWISFGTDDSWNDGFLIIKSKSSRNTVSLQFSSDYIPLLEHLHSHFTWFYLDNIINFKSKHTIKLYQFLMSWHDSKYIITHKKVTINELKSIFELSESSYMVKRINSIGNKYMVFDIYNFEKKCLLKAIDEINEDVTKSGLYIEYSKIKENGFVIGYDFAFSRVDINGNRI